MNVILLEKIANLGELGDQVAVKAGYGRNFLIPHGKAVPATTSNVADFETRRVELEKASADKKTAAQGRATELADVSLTIEANAGDEGKMFGSLGTRDIADAITASGKAVAKSEVRMPEGAIRMLGDYQILISLHADVEVTVAVSVIAEQ